MNTVMQLHTLIEEKQLTKNYLRKWQRFIAAFMGYFLLLQLCLPTVAIAATMLTNEQFSSVLNSPVYKNTGKTSGYYYSRPNYLQADTQSGGNIASFYKSLSPTKATLPESTLIIGDDFVQQRLIRSQISMFLGRTLVDPSKLLLSGEAKKAYEVSQNDSLFAAGVQFGSSTSKAFGTPLTSQTTIPNDMIWPEKRSINGADVITPVVYLSQATLNTKPVGHQINFGLSTIFNNIEVNKGVVVSASGNENYTTIITAINNIVNSGSLSGAGNLNLVAGNTLANLSGKIQANNNLDISVVKGNVINKTQLLPYQSKDGSGTRLGTIATIDSISGNIKITSGGNIAYEGGSSNAFYGALTFNANGDIILTPVATNSTSTTKDGGWTVNKSSFELMQSKLTANQMLTLMAGGTISITASELYSTQGGIQLLAKHGIYIADEQGYFQSNRIDKLGRTTGTGSDFESFAVRSVLSAGKGVLIAADSGDVTLKSAKITAGEGTQVKAVNGKVHLLVTKENSQHYLDTIRKGTWTIKTVHEEYVKETGIPNAIVGGLAVEALFGVDVEYAGREGATLAQQIAEYDKMPDTKWMADIYYGKTKFKDANGNLVPLNSVVDFSQVDLAYKHIREHNTSLSPAAMAIIAICVAIAMGPAGAGLIGGGGGGIIGSAVTASLGPIAGAAANAAVLTLATSAAQNLAAGKSLEDTLKAITSNQGLKNLAISMATAGALSGLDIGHMELFDDAPIGSALDFANQSYQAVVNSVVTTGISVTIDGGNSEDYRKAFTRNLAVSAVNTIGQNLTNKISSSNTLSEASKYITQAAMGCLTQGLTAKLSETDFKDACASGAGGAVIAQGVADGLNAYTKSVAEKLGTPGYSNVEFVGPALDYLRVNRVDISKLVAALAAYAFKGDVNAAASSADSVATTNLAKAVDLMEIYLEIVGDRDYGNVTNFVDKRAILNEDVARQKLRNMGWGTEAEIEAFISKQRSAGLFLKAAQLDDQYWASGKNIDTLVNYREQLKLDPSNDHTIGYDGEVINILVLGDKEPTFTMKVAGFTGDTERFKNSLTPREREALGFTTSVIMGGPVKAVINKGFELGINLFMPQSVAETLGDIDHFYTKYVGGAGTAWLLGEDYSQIVNSYENQSDSQIVDDINGIIWISQQVTGLPGKKTSNSSIKNVGSNEPRITPGSKAKDIPSSTVILKNADGLSEVKVGQYSSDAYKRLNKPDSAVSAPGKEIFKPAEAVMAAQLESSLGEMTRYDKPSIPGKKNPDFEIVSGPNKGQTVDAMYTTVNATQREIDDLNKYFTQQMTEVPKWGGLPPGQAAIIKHFEANFVPVDFKVLTSTNQIIFLNYIKTLPSEQQAKIIIVR